MALQAFIDYQERQSESAYPRAWFNCRGHVDSRPCDYLALLPCTMCTPWRVASKISDQSYQMWEYATVVHLDQQTTNDVLDALPK